MKENTPVIKTILMPVNLDDLTLAMAKQVAGLAKDHGAALHLLYVVQTGNIFGRKGFSSFFCTESFVSFANQRKGLLQTWQRSLQVLYGIKVSAEVCYGNWAECILSAASDQHADLIALTTPPVQKWWAAIKSDPLETVMRRSHCQVITIFSGASSIAEWKNIVIPVIGFIPELRIKTIYRIAKSCHVKIHLVTLDSSGNETSSKQFPYIMDTLKMLKAAGNIQVECCCIKRSINPEHSFVAYADKVQADALMTYKRFPHSRFKTVWRGMVKPFLKMNYYQPETMYQPSL